VFSTRNKTKFPIVDIPHYYDTDLFKEFEKEEGTDEEVYSVFFTNCLTELWQQPQNYEYTATRTYNTPYIYQLLHPDFPTSRTMHTRGQYYHDIIE
jgi:hypothetical protein